jgi:hypothetical protein
MSLTALVDATAIQPQANSSVVDRPDASKGSL